MRSAMVAAELMPAELAALWMEQKHQGTVFGASADALKQMVPTIRDHYGVDIPLDKSQADVMVLSSAVDLMGNGNGLLATAKVINRLGVNWMVRSDGFESADFGLLSGDMGLWKTQADPIIDAARCIGAKTLVITECGHAYPALRWNPMVTCHDPREVWAFVQRICGVCTLVHGMAGVRAVEDALDYKIPPNAELIRNLMIGAQYVHDHVMHFYHLHALDWFDVVSALNADPKATSDWRSPISS